MSTNSGEDIIDSISATVDGIQFYKRRKWVVLTFLFLGMVSGVIYILLHPLEYKSYYKKDFVVQSTVITEEILTDIVEGLNQDEEESRNILGLSAPVVESLRSISIIESATQKDIEDKDLPVMTVKLRIETLQKENVDSLITGVIRYINYYININEHLRTKYDIVLHQNLQLLKVVDAEIAELESIKNKLPADPDNVGIYLNYVGLFEKKQKIERHLKLLHTVKYIEVHMPVTYNINFWQPIGTIFKFSLMGLVLGVLVGILFNFTIQVRETMRLREL